jgi:hypothetical protein
MLAGCGVAAKFAEGGVVGQGLRISWPRHEELSYCRQIGDAVWLDKDTLLVGSFCFSSFA